MILKEYNILIIVHLDIFNFRIGTVFTKQITTNNY